MNYKTILINDFSDAKFQEAFRTYFAEEEMHIKDWKGLFAEMNRQKDNAAFVRTNGKGEVVGFLQFQPGEMEHWFFRESVGFIREFWICPTYRGEGHGKDLLALTETHFMERGITRILLTADKAEGFYLCHGYRKAAGIQAKNQMDVFEKQL